MYTIVAGTNRIGSNSLKVAKEYRRMLQEKGIDAHLFSLEGLNLLNRNSELQRIEEEIIRPTERFLFIAPEYNGSYPGVLKMLFDIGQPQLLWWHKKALLTGVATGRSGNVRGMEHLAGVLNYLKVSICPNLLPLSQVDKLLDEEGRLKDPATIQVVQQQIDQFINWCQ